MVFLSSNSLHTGFVTLTGTNLIVELAESQSPELPIGWPTTLQHNTKYTIATMNRQMQVMARRYSLPTSVVIYVDSGPSSDSSLFCGDFNRPCSSIEFGWKIVEVFGFSSLSISILHNTTQKEQIKIMSQHEVVIESGPSTKPELFVSPSLSSSSLEGEGMVDVSGGRLWIHQVDVALSDSPSLIFIRMVGGQLTLESCSLTSTSSTPQLESAASLCSWSGRSDCS
ncbi:hypothetical protein BLNAU_24905 [Blattamonas nauphoetae]|uniref:Uncharacterized protein n=1 Tax=Blattamonas nauphoetae TaxID=2049346 RepID=A0ABQ9WLH8_9EUKA|nr:hypothetical protein BLNAU_24905 [Blattamonas nauphoetae]